MDESRREERVPSRVRLSILDGRSQVTERLLGQVKDAQAMGEAAVIGAGVGDVAETELMDPPQALDLGTIQQIEEPTIPAPVDADIVVQRVAEDLRGHVWLG
jgi:hypothetical protein